MEGSSIATEESTKLPGEEIDIQKMTPLCRKTLCSLHLVWDEMGLSKDERKRQIASIVEQIEAVFHSKLEDEKALANEYKRLASALKEEINVLRKHILELVPEDEPDLHIPEEEEISLTKTLTWLRGEKEKLDAIKAERLKLVKTMQQKLMEMWDELGEEPEPNFATVGDKLTVERVEEFEAHLIVVKQQRENRLIAVRSACEDICELFQELEIKPTEELDVAITKNTRAGGGAQSTQLIDLDLTMDTVQKISQRARELTEEKISRTERIKQLGSQIQPLWELLEVTEEYRTQFFMENRGLGEMVIKQCEAELQKLLILKKDKMKELIQNNRRKISELLDQIGQNSNVPHDTYHEIVERSVFNDENLAEHEELVRILTEQSNALQPILKNVEKYLALVEDRKDYETKIQDSSRLLSRKRGSLREEEMQRKRVTVQLPKLIKTLRLTIAAYEEEYGEFFVEGEKFIDRMEAFETQHDKEVEEAKLAKQRAKRQQKDTLGTPQKSRTPYRGKYSATKENIYQQ